MSFSWSVTPEQAWGDWAEAFADAVEADIVALAENISEQAEAWMKANARWQDQSGDARQALFSLVYHAARESVTILVSHGSLIEYALFLELHPGLGIIADTVDHFGPQLYRGVQEILARHGG